jgi:geranylgeranyl pyrophosphate synthase
MVKARALIKERGEKAYEIAKRAILEEKIMNKRIYDALHFFMEEVWFDFQHPALLSLTCEAVGGDPNVTTHVGAAMVLLAGSADIHDDIIDESKIKGIKPTVYGKFGKDIALLTGDALMFKGITTMYDACEKLHEETRNRILNLTRQGFFEIGSAEAKEVDLKGKYDLTPQEYYEVIEMKAGVADVNARIGAILGGGTQVEIDAVGHYSRTLGILMIIRDDFIDLYEPDELMNRVNNECLPLPLLYVFQNEKKKEEIIHLLEKDRITDQETDKILDLVMETKEIEELRKEMISLTIQAKNALKNLRKLKNILELLIDATLEDL